MGLSDVQMGDALQAGCHWTQTPAGDALSRWAVATIPIASSSGIPPDEDGVVVFGSGEPDPATLPHEGLAAAARRVLERDAWGALRYGDTQGEECLRRWLACRLNAQEDAGVGPEHFFLTSGSGEAIKMVIAAFADPGDPVLVENPSYPSAMRVIRANGSRPVGVEMDDEGVRLDALERTVAALAAEGRPPRLFYTMPTYHNPCGTTTSLDRREAIAAFCDRRRILIVEDDAYGEIRLDGPRLPSYYKLTGGDGALRLSTVSKMLAPGLRIGWVTARPPWIDALSTLRLDGGLGPFVLRLVAEYFASGEEDAHLGRMVPVYREKRDRMIAALHERCARHATWTQPDGGFFLWLKLADHIAPNRLREVMAEERVAARFGGQFHADGQGDEYLRLCFSTHSVADIEEGIRRLGRALDRSAG